jgi:hypothetical protein
MRIDPMIASRLVTWAAALAVVFGVSHLAPAVAAEGEAPDADVVVEASSPSPKSPIRVKVVDYVKESDGPGTFKLSGTAIAGSSVYIYLDDKPFAQVVAAKDDGAWSAEDKVEIDDKVHVVRVEQFDEATNLLAGRAQFSISLGKPSAEDLAAPPSRMP